MIIYSNVSAKRKQVIKSETFILIIVTLVTMTSIDSFSQSQPMFQKTYTSALGQECHDIIKTSDGGYMMCGDGIMAGFAGLKGLIVKTDEWGDTLWTRGFGPATNYLFSIKQTIDRGYIACGLLAGDFGDFWVLRLDSLGNLIWSKAIGTVQADIAEDVIITNDGGFLVAGSTQGIPGGNPNSSEPMLAKFDSAGNHLWTRTYRCSIPQPNPVYSILEEQNHDLLLSSGSTNNLCTPALSHLSKTDSAGNLLSIWSYGVMSGNEAPKNIYHIEKTSDYGFLACGSSDVSPGGENYFIMKLDSNGQVVWNRSLETWNTGVCLKCKETPDGSYITAGYISQGTFADPGDVMMVKFAANGDTLWTRFYSDTLTEQARSMDLTDDGGIVAAGFTSSYGSSYDMYLLKADSLGYAGCNEKFHTVTVDSLPIVQYTTYSGIIDSTIGTVYTPALTVHSGLNVMTLCTNVGLEEIPQTNLLLYPNPVTGNTVTLTLQNAVFSKGSCLITDLLGRTVFESSVTDLTSEIQLSLPSLSPGVYFISVQNKTSRHVAKLLVE
ncbi:MAG TPA: T9SS type A sorting domain-containing protein [Bacteroidia bacterium]|nr:T9SS type A sorting domain-containing protein [Bacteroidia bacterium]